MEVDGVSGARSRAYPRQKVGYEHVRSMVDDHPRMAYSEVLDSPGRTRLRPVHARRRSVVRLVYFLWTWLTFWWVRACLVELWVETSAIVKGRPWWDALGQG